MNKNKFIGKVSKKQLKLYLNLVGLFVCIFQHGYIHSNSNASDNKLYNTAVLDSIVATPGKIRPLLNPMHGRLKSINGKDYVLVSSIMKKSYTESYDTHSGKHIKSLDKDNYDFTQWVSLYPELRNKINNFKNSYKKHHNQSKVPFSEIANKTHQLLGEPPVSAGEAETSDYYVVSFWIEPTYLNRPCINPETNNVLCFPDTYLPKTVPAGFKPTLIEQKFMSSQNKYANDPSFNTIRASKAYQKWFNANKNSSYIGNAYPWTRLGYTYDWGPESEDHYGVTEFIIMEGISPDQVIVESIRSLEEYLEDGAVSQNKVLPAPKV